MMKSRGRRPIALAWGATPVRSMTPMCICPATALTMSCSLTRPFLTSTSPRRPPALRWCSSALSTCALVTRPLATSIVPSLRRPSSRRVRPLSRSSSLTPSSSGENGLVMNSAAPRRWARSNAGKSPLELRARTGTPRSSGSVVMRRNSSGPSKVLRSRSRRMAAGGVLRRTDSVPGSPRLADTSYRLVKWRTSSSRRSVSSSTIASRFLVVPATWTSR